MSSNTRSQPSPASEGFTEPSYVSQLTTDELKQHIQGTRDRLSSTLDDLEDKANIPKQLGKVRHSMEKKFAIMKRERPMLLVGIGVGAVAAAVGLIAVVVKSSRK